MLAEKYGWDARQVNEMTPAQIQMYVGKDAAVEQEAQGVQVDRRTGHRIAKVGSPAEAAALIRKLKQ